MYIKNIILILKNSISVKEKIERLLKDEAIKVSVDQETVNERD
jgi:galactitol-specific phosphotransferase system IIB component